VSVGNAVVIELGIVAVAVVVVGWFLGMTASSVG
jgi:hypothetical protein